MAGPTRTIDVAAVIERAPVGRFQIGTLALCVVIMLMDGFDVQAISYTAPVLKLVEPVTRAALAPVFSAGLFGLMLGALLVGYLADVIGRRASLILCLLGFGTLSLGTAQVDTIGALLAMRFATGLMLGGVMPNAVSLAAEYAPRGRRALASTMTICGFSGGAALDGILAGQLLETYSWRSVLYVGGWCRWCLPRSRLCGCQSRPGCWRSRVPGRGSSWPCLRVSIRPGGSPRRIVSCWRRNPSGASLSASSLPAGGRRRRCWCGWRSS